MLIIVNSCILFIICPVLYNTIKYIIKNKEKISEVTINTTKKIYKPINNDISSDTESMLAYQISDISRSNSISKNP